MDPRLVWSRTVHSGLSFYNQIVIDVFLGEGWGSGVPTYTPSDLVLWRCVLVSSS